jgi:hypothetical protein
MLSLEVRGSYTYYGNSSYFSFLANDYILRLYIELERYVSESIATGKRL